MNKVLTFVTVLVLLTGCQVAKQEQSLEDQLKKIMLEAETAAKKGDRKLVISTLKEYKQLVQEESSNKEAQTSAWLKQKFSFLNIALSKLKNP